MKDFLFGKIVNYEIVTDTKIFNIGGRSYTYKEKVLTVKDGFKKIATFQNIKSITKL